MGKNTKPHAQVNFYTKECRTHQMAMLQVLQVFLQITYAKYLIFKRKPEAKHEKEMCKPLQDLKKLPIPSQLSQPLISHSPPAGTMIQ